MVYYKYSYILIIIINKIYYLFCHFKVTSCNIRIKKLIIWQQVTGLIVSCLFIYN